MFVRSAAAVTRLCFLLLAVSELQEEGMNAINLPLSPIPFELDPEDTMLGNWVSCSLG